MDKEPERFKLGYLSKEDTQVVIRHVKKITQCQ